MRDMIRKIIQVILPRRSPPGIHFSNAELVEAWRAMAYQRQISIEIFEANAAAYPARVSAGVLRCAMLKVRAEAEKRGVEVDFDHPAIVSFSRENWRDVP